MSGLFDLRQFHQVFHNHALWEDWKHGLYKLNRSPDQAVLSKNLLASPDFKKSCLLVISDWKHSTEQNLTNLSLNRRAWLGQAACCLNHGASFIETIEGWNMLNPMEQLIANRTATDCIRQFEWDFVSRPFHQSCPIPTP